MRDETPERLVAEATHFKCTCQQCSGHVEFPIELAGSSIPCPHCGAAMDLVGPEIQGPSHPAEKPFGASQLATGFRGRLKRQMPRLSYSFALAVAATAMVALPIAYLAVIGLIGWTYVAFIRNWFPWKDGFTGSPLAFGLKTGLFLAGLFVGGFVLLFLVKPLFARPSRRAQTLALNPAAEPLLFAFIQMICDTIGARRPARVDVDCRLNASVALRHRLSSILKGEVRLTLGLPMVALLSLRQLAGVLAHELGHYNQGFGLRTLHLVRTIHGWLARVAHERDAWDEAVEHWASESRSATARIILGIARAGVGLSRGVLLIIGYAGRAVSCLLLRQMELEADQVQVELVGSEEFETTFRRAQVLRRVSRDFYRRLRSEWHLNRQLPDNLPAALLQAEAALSDHDRDRLAEREERTEANEGIFRTHPPDAERIERARDAAKSGLFQLDGPATALFSEFDVLARQVTLLHYEEDLGLPRESIKLISVESWTRQPGTPQTLRARNDSLSSGRGTG